MGRSTYKNQGKENSGHSGNINDKEMKSELSEYEKIRQQNIIERERMFEELRIKDAKCENSVVKRPITKKRTVLGPKEPIEPVRKSRRLAGGVPEIVRFTPGLDDHPLDPDLESKPRRRIAPENYNDYLHATRTFTGDETPDTLAEVNKERFKILHVPKKCTIKQFVLSNNLEFKVGRGFYEFTKPEIISHKKEVVLVDKDSGEFFSGRDAARMIKGTMQHLTIINFINFKTIVFPAGSGLRIPPTTFTKWRVFVQSTSYGRNLMSGTSFLYEV